MNQLVPSKSSRSGEFYAGNNTFICRPGEGDSVYCPRHGDLIPDPKKGIRWAHPVIVAAILMSIGGIIGGVSQTIGAVTAAYLTHPSTDRVADKCLGALAHYQEALKQELLRDALEDHLNRFPNCDYAGLAKTKMAGIIFAAAAQPRQVIASLPPPQTIVPVQAVTSALSPQQDNFKAQKSIDQIILDSTTHPIQTIRNIFEE